MSKAIFHQQRVHNALVGQVELFRKLLDARIKQKLSGELLQSRSGTLAASVLSSVDSSETETTISASSTGVPYAAIQEFGGKTSAHEIIALNAKALAFRTGGEQVFRKHIHHPGAELPGRPYLHSALAEMQEDMTFGIKQAILTALTPS